MTDDNTFLGEVSGVDPLAPPDNAFLAAGEATNLVAVRENAYAPGRAHVIVDNPDGLDHVEVDLSDVLARGAAFELPRAGRSTSSWCALTTAAEQHRSRRLDAVCAPAP